MICSATILMKPLKDTVNAIPASLLPLVTVHIAKKSKLSGVDFAVAMERFHQTVVHTVTAEVSICTCWVPPTQACCKWCGSPVLAVHCC